MSAKYDIDGDVCQEPRADTLLVVTYATKNASGSVVQYIAGGHVDGVLLVALHGTDSLPAALARQGLPVHVPPRAPLGQRLDSIRQSRRPRVVAPAGSAPRSGPTEQEFRCVPPLFADGP